MSEISLRLEQVSALLLSNLAAVLLLGLAWLALLACVLMRGGARWRPTRPLAVFAGVVSTLSALFIVPGLSGLSFGAVANWADWVSLLGIALTAGLITFAFAWPAVATAFRTPPSAS